MSGSNHVQDTEGEGESISLAGVNYPESTAWDKDPAPLQDSSAPGMPLDFDLWVNEVDKAA